MKTRVISIVFLLTAIGLAYFLVSRIKFAIDEEQRIEVSEAAVIEKLKLIRDIQIAYQEIHSRYTDNWDSLINFAKYGQYPITKRSETIIEKPYGGDSVIVNIDTLEIITVKEYIFFEEHNVYAADDGLFIEYLVNPGDYVVKGQKIYTMVSATTGKMVDQIAKEGGRVGELSVRARESQLAKADLLFSMVEEKYDPNTNFDNLAFIPLTVNNWQRRFFLCVCQGGTVLQEARYGVCWSRQELSCPLSKGWDLQDHGQLAGRNLLCLLV